MARHAKKIDYTHWTGGFGGAATFGAGTVGQNILAAQHQPETLLRMRGYYSAFLDGVQAPGVQVRITAGLILVPEGTGTTVLWSPETDADAPWIWWTGFDLAYEEGVIDVVDMPQMTAFREVIDNKAMRIIRNQELQLVQENVTVTSASNINSGLQIRILSGH